MLPRKPVGAWRADSSNARGRLSQVVETARPSSALAVRRRTAARGLLNARRRERYAAVPASGSRAGWKEGNFGSEMAPQRLEKIESRLGNGMGSDASNLQHLVHGRAADGGSLGVTGELFLPCKPLKTHETELEYHQILPVRRTPKQRRRPSRRTERAATPTPRHRWRNRREMWGGEIFLPAIP